jgi:hypothetical protein
MVAGEDRVESIGHLVVAKSLICVHNATQFSVPEIKHERSRTFVTSFP